MINIIEELQLLQAYSVSSLRYIVYFLYTCSMTIKTPCLAYQFIFITKLVARLSKVIEQNIVRGKKKANKPRLNTRESPLEINLLNAMVETSNKERWVKFC